MAQKQNALYQGDDFSNGMTQQQYIDALNQQQAKASGNGHALKNSKRNLVPKKTIGGNGNAMRFRRQLITKGGNKSSNGNNQSGS